MLFATVVFLLTLSFYWNDDSLVWRCPAFQGPFGHLPPQAAATEEENISSDLFSVSVLLNSETKTSSRNRQKHVIRSVFFQFCTICPIWKWLNLPAKGQVGPDPPSPFYFFGQASCARNQSLWVLELCHILQMSRNKESPIVWHLSSSRKFSLATSAWLRAAMFLEQGKFWKYHMKYIKQNENMANNGDICA